MSDPREKICTHERQFPAPRRFISIRCGMVLVSVAGTKEGGGRVLAECARYESAFPHPGDMMTTSLVRGPRPGPVGRLLRLLVIVPQAGYFDKIYGTQGGLDRQGDDGRERKVYYLAFWACSSDVPTRYGDA